ncbi:protein wech [Bombyx mori]|uniref:B box-type domain-containing protein n=1 Tax=Bombyx mori TaxID=7091 RepID=A0A8R2M3F4_BOMMO|nr:protein wech [Bombyx mori]XP_037873656.1 protein wech [Bombyx mori]XP_037873657.1 protein wech [Bombyx mori]
MTTLAKLARSLATGLPSTSNTVTAEADPPVVETEEETDTMSQIICNLLENMNKPSALQAGSSSHSSSTVPYDIWALPSSSSMPNPLGPISREYGLSNNNNQQQTKEENSSGSPGTSSSVSITCFRCEERTPTTRCLECNDLFCHECCHKVTSDCQLREHTLLPIHQISPIGARPNSVNNEKEVIYCELHGDPVRFYCEACIIFICQECTLWVHKDHCFTPMKGALDMCRVGVFRAIEDTKTGTKAIKTAIDRAVAMSKAYEKETAEANMKIRKAMRCYAQAIEDREKYLLDKVEKMRQAKMNELSDHMNTLRGILAGLAHTNETLVRCMDSDGIELFMAKEKGRAQVDYFSCMFKNMYITEERIMFIPPNYDLVDQLKRQCDVQSVPVNSMHSLNSSSLATRQSLLSLQSLQSGQSLSHLSYIGSSSLRSLSEYSTRSTNYYDHSISSSMALEPNVSRGIGQAIPGYWMSVTVRPTRSPVPGVPMFSFGREGQDEGQVSRPWGLCVDKEGNIIVADRRNNRIQIFNSRGEFKMMFGSKGTGSGEFDLPAGITTDTYGRIIVIDKDNHRVQIFTSSGNFILKFGSFGKECGQFQYPWDVAVNSLGNIVVTDTRNHRIQLFTSDGTYITKFVFEGANPAKMLKGPTTPRGVCFTTSGNIIVSDFENHRLLMVDPTLTKVLHCVGREGSGIGELNRPSGIVTDDDGRIVVADSKNHRVLVFTSELRILWAVDLKSPGLDDKDRPSDVALTPEGYLVVLFETLPDTARDVSSHGKQYIKVY